MLAGGDRRSIGRSDKVVATVESSPGKVRQLIKLMWDSDPLVSMRAADALEKVSRGHRALLSPYKSQLLGLAAESTQQEIRWHLAVLIPRLTLTPSECQHFAHLLESYLEDRSSIVKTFAMQGLYDLTRQDHRLLGPVTDAIRALARSGTAAMRARGRHLLKLLESKDL